MFEARHESCNEEANGLDPDLTTHFFLSYFFLSFCSWEHEKENKKGRGIAGES